MKNIYFTVGPSQLYPTVIKHIASAIKKDIPSLNHRGKEFKEIYQHTENMLRNILNIPQSSYVFFVSSGHEGMERVLMNTVYKHSFHLVSGAFSEKFYNQALGLKKQPKKIEILKGAGFDFKKIKISKNTEVICITQNETSTGVAINMRDIYSLKKIAPQALIAIDVVSSVPYVTIDFAQIDMAFFSVQKGFGLPSGLGVLIVNDKAIEKAKLLKDKNAVIGSYHDFLSLHKSFLKKQTPETPNILNIYLLGKVAEDLLHHGVEKMKKETEQKAKLLYDFFDNHSLYKPFVSPEHRSPTTIVINTQGDTEKILDKLKKRGYVVSRGYGERKEDQIRIANFPAHTIRQVKAFLLLTHLSHNF